MWEWGFLGYSTDRLPSSITLLHSCYTSGLKILCTTKAWAGWRSLLSGAPNLLVYALTPF
jgi:hypothetical protein